MDFSRPDAIDAQKLNAILWQDAKGSQAPHPARLRKPQEERRNLLIPHLRNTLGPQALLR
jgi:hypothetical protein